MAVIPVTDRDDPVLDDYRRLSEPRYRRQVETAEPPGFLIAEGPEVVKRLIGSGLVVRSVLVTPAMRERFAELLGTVDAPVMVADRSTMQDVVGFDLHRGIVASGQRPAPRTVVDLTSLDGTLAVLEGINDHENLGALLRSAAALGIGGVVLDPTCCDPYYRRSVRVSMGAALVLPIARSGAWEADLGIIRNSGRDMVAMTLGNEAVRLDEIDRHRSVAVMLGAEGPGLSATALRHADVEAFIPMNRGMDSLNVGHAGALAFHWFGS